MKIGEALDWFNYKCSYCGISAVSYQSENPTVLPGFSVAVIFDETLLLCQSCLKRHREVVSEKLELSPPQDKKQRVRKRDERRCGVPKCPITHHKIGFCYEHWKLYLRGIPVGAPGNVTRICCMEGCNDPHWARGWCRSHYQSMRQSLPDSKCTEPGCDDVRRSKDYCQFHLRRIRSGISFNAPFRTNGKTRSNNAKLNPEKVRMILSSEATHSVLAERLGVSRSTISLVRNRKVWAWVLLTK